MLGPSHLRTNAPTLTLTTSPPDPHWTPSCLCGWVGAPEKNQREASDAAGWHDLTAHWWPAFKDKLLGRNTGPQDLPPYQPQDR